MSVYKKKVPWKEVEKRFFFLSEPANFYASDQHGRNFSAVRKEKLYLIKLVPKWKRAIGKGHTNISAFNFWDLKLVPIVSALNSASGNLTYFFKYVGMVPKTATKRGQETYEWKRISQIMILTLTCDPALFPARNSLNSAKCNCIFPGKRRGDRALILAHLDN